MDNEGISTTDKKKCPKCKETYVVMAGFIKSGMIINGKIKGPKYNIYKCSNPKCQHLFKVRIKEE